MSVATDEFGLNLALYREQEHVLRLVRELHGGQESAEEDGVLEAMEALWYRLTPDEQERLRTEGSRCWPAGDRSDAREAGMEKTTFQNVEEIKAFLGAQLQERPDRAGIRQVLSTPEGMETQLASFTRDVGKLMWFRFVRHETTPGELPIVDLELESAWIDRETRQVVERPADQPPEVKDGSRTL